MSSDPKSVVDVGVFVHLSGPLQAEVRPVIDRGKDLGVYCLEIGKRATAVHVFLEPNQLVDLANLLLSYAEEMVFDAKGKDTEIDKDAARQTYSVVPR